MPCRPMLMSSISPKVLQVDPVVKGAVFFLIPSNSKIFFKSQVNSTMKMKTRAGHRLAIPAGEKAVTILHDVLCWKYVLARK